LPLLYNWFMSVDQPPSGTSTAVGTGPSITTNANGSLLRLFVSDAGGHQNMAEVPIDHLCTR
jgi:hypothetical protein